MLKRWVPPGTKLLHVSGMSVAFQLHFSCMSVTCHSHNRGMEDVEELGAAGQREVGGALGPRVRENVACSKQVCQLHVSYTSVTPPGM